MPRISWLVILIMLSSCANIFGQDKREITVNTATGKPAFCTLKNSGGEWHGYSGKPIIIDAESSGEMKITCVTGNLRAVKTIKSDEQNLYPNNVTVVMRAKKTYSHSPTKDNDDESINDTGDDSPQEDMKPLNVLRDDINDSETEVIITKH